MAQYKIEIIVDGRDDASKVFNDVDDSLSRMDGKPRGIASQFGDLTGAIDGVLAVGFVSKFGEAVVNLNNLGREIGPTKEAFVELNGSTEAANALLEDMQESTNGVVDNFTLMSAANAMKLTGVVESDEQIAALTGNVVKLGAALGQDATASIENFNAALLNNSYERLDTLGVSAANVRARVAELKAEGYEMSEAFSIATIEQMELSVARLGTAANASATAFAQLSTKVQNLNQWLAENVAVAGEAGAQLALLATEGLLDDFFQVATGGHSDAARDWAKATADEYAAGLMTELGDSAIFDQAGYARVIEEVLLNPTREFSDILGDMGINSNIVDPAILDQLVQAAEYAQDMELANARAADEAERQAEVLAAFGDRSGDRAFLEGIGSAVGASEELVAVNEEMERQAYRRGIIEERNARNRFMEEEAAQGALSAQIQLDRELAEQQQRRIEQSAAAQMRDEEMAQAALADHLQLQNEIGAATDASAQALADSMNLAAGGAREFNGMEIATQGAADEAARLATKAEQAFLQAQNLGLEGDQLDSFKSAADETREIADQMGRAAENLRTMDLETALGSGTDASQNLLRDVLEASGLDREQAMVVTGETSGAEQRFEEEVAPLLESIRTQLGDEAGNEAAARFTEAYRAGLEGGLGEDAALNMAMGGVGFEADRWGNMQEMQSQVPLAQLTGANDAQNAAGLLGMQDRSGDLVSGIGTGAGAESPEMMQEQNSALETRSGLVSDIVSNMLAAEGSMSPEVTGVSETFGMMEDMQAQITDMNGKRVTVNIHYKITNDGRVPPGAEVAGVSVPVTGGEM